MNYLLLLEKLQVYQNTETKILCGEEGNGVLKELLCNNGHFSLFCDEVLTIKCLNKVWHCVMLWEHTLILINNC
ncbi:hypothetical protein NQ317_008535 [Molorchus minor]|uniref:Uncharacterized protein n=1 Tax=Molorchus minor TaxID=1323400 RepID=A0ABQ9IZN2_9CUCU|nr:hypothetical protein NQ317_008535 [Molorchus minor]